MNYEKLLTEQDKAILASLAKTKTSLQLKDFAHRVVSGRRQRVASAALRVWKQQQGLHDDSTPITLRSCEPTIESITTGAGPRQLNIH